MGETIVGVFIGGASSRMGGKPKGLIVLRSGETILARALNVCAQARLDAVLVGNVDAYDAIARCTRIHDSPSIEGPLAGLHALLTHAGDRSVIAIACDMPFVDAALLSRLVHESPAADVLAPRSLAGDKWEPLCARYRSPRALPALEAAIDRGVRSFQGLFRSMSVTELPLSEAERQATRDWDTPQDIT